MTANLLFATQKSLKGFFEFAENRVRQLRGFSPHSHQTHSIDCYDLAVSAPALLIVDDEANLLSMLGAALRHHGFDVTEASGGVEAMDRLAHEQPDLIILDVMMPDLDGFEVCRRVRQQGNQTPILFLTAKATTEDKVRGFTLGGDDYLEKPFSLDELIARALAILRRSGLTITSTRLELEDLVMNEDLRVTTRAGREISLSPTEYNLLRFLMINQGRVVSRAQILDHVWQYDFDGESGVIETYISYLRKKVDFVEPKLIQTVRGVGYTMRPVAHG